MKNFGTLFVAVVLLALFSSSAISQTLFFEENFNYRADTLTVVSGGNWTNFSGTGYKILVSNGDLSYPGYKVAGGDSGKITLSTNTASAEDIMRTFPTQTGTVYASMLINVLDTTRLWPNSSSNGDYFTGFLPSTSTSNYICRFSIKRSTNDSTFLLGIRAVTTSATTWATKEYSIGKTHLIVFSYQIIADTSNDIASLWINPNLSGTMPPADVISIASGTEQPDIARLFFRQAYTNPSSTPHVEIDKIRVADSWSEAPLPVELVSFTAILQKGNNVVLNWSTATEVNNQGFEIQRSSENSNFTKVGFVGGYGTTTNLHSYSFIDENLLPGIYSYRLKQLDNNGTFKYSYTIESEVLGLTSFELSQNYPNPFNPETKINYSIPVAGNVSMVIYNSLGQKIRTLFSGNQDAGWHKITWNGKDDFGKNVPSGIYLARIESGNNFKSIKMQLLK
jgi:hypothetical protein